MQSLIFIAMQFWGLKFKTGKGFDTSSQLGKHVRTYLIEMKYFGTVFKCFSFKIDYTYVGGEVGGLSSIYSPMALLISSLKSIQWSTHL